MQVEDLVKTLLREQLAEALAPEFAALRQEIAVQVRTSLRETAENLRAYSDAQVCRKLNFSRTTLWHLRDDVRGPHILISGYAYPGSRTRRTTATQIRNYLALIEAHADSIVRQREEDDLRLDTQLERHGRRGRSAT
jgi:hypothetical protein